MNPLDFSTSTYILSHSGFGYPEIGVRVTHTPSGVYAESSSERSQHANKAKALEELEEYVLKMETKSVQKMLTFKVWLDSGANSQSCYKDTVEVPEDEWQSLTAEEQEDYMRQIAFNRADWGYCEVK